MIPEIINIIEIIRYLVKGSSNKSTPKNTPASGMRKTNECKDVAPNFERSWFQATNPKEVATKD